MVTLNRVFFFSVSIVGEGERGGRTGFAGDLQAARLLGREQLSEQHREVMHPGCARHRGRIFTGVAVGSGRR